MEIMRLNDGSVKVLDEQWYTPELSFSPTQPIIALEGREQLTLYSIPDITPVLPLGKHVISEPLVFSSDGQLIAMVSDFGIIEVWDTVDGNLRKRFLLEDRTSATLAISPDNQLLVAVLTDEIILYEISGGTQLRRIPLKTKCLHSVGFSPDGRLLVVSGEDGIVRVFGVE